MRKKTALLGVADGKRRRRSRHRHDGITTGRRSDSDRVVSLGSGAIEMTGMGADQSIDVMEVGDRVEYCASQAIDLCPPGPAEEVEEHFADEAGDEETENSEEGVGPRAMPSCAASSIGVEGHQEQNSNMGDDMAVFASSENLVLDNWRVLWAFLLTKGSRKLTKSQFQSVRNLAYGFAAMTATSWKPNKLTSVEAEIEFRNKFSVLPHYSTVQKKHAPVVLNMLAPRAVEHQETVDETKAGARFESRTQDGNAKITVRTILPSEYARADVSSPAVWAEMRSTSFSASRDVVQPLPAVLSNECIDVVPLISARSWFYGPQKSMHLDSVAQNSLGGFCSYAEVGDTVNVALLGDGDFTGLSESLERSFGGDRAEKRPAFIRGVFAHSWTVHASSREHDPMHQEEYSYEVHARDRDISKLFNFVSYQSPSDSVCATVPPLTTPAMQNTASAYTVTDEHTSEMHAAQAQEARRKRRAALRERSKLMDAAWKSWAKPLLKPGDFVVLLRPCTDDQTVPGASGVRPRRLLTEVDKLSRICIVHRFWGEHEERSRHLFFISGGTDICTGPENVQNDPLSLLQYCATLRMNQAMKYVNVRSISMEKEHRGQRGPQKSTPVSSAGVLDTGELYFVYRVILFWDGFRMQSGNSASGEGVYMLCLNLPEKARSSSSAVRILTLTPPVVKVSGVLHRIFQNIVKGASEGFLDYDADGTERRIFIDLVGVVGDTPALNSVLDVLGHTASSCCHLCRFLRQSKTSVGSRYGSNIGNGSHTSFRRGYFQHCAVHDCGAKEETCRLLGVRSDPSDGQLPLHSFQKSLFEAKRGIPTVDGMPVVPYHFDPYMASFVAPDHLLSGHLRDCISLVLKLLPSKRHLAACERFILRFLSEAGLPSQNRLFDHATATLHTMSMTDIFAVGVVAELGFLCGCAEVGASSPGTYAVLSSSKCIAAIHLVGSCSSLIADMWFRPNQRRDGQKCVSAFEHCQGADRMIKIQNAADAHIAKVEALCMMSDDDKEELDDDDCSRQRKSELKNMHRVAMAAIKCVDKPNIHRLREIVHTTLPMLGHLSLFGELVLEKCHQRLKRALKMSNNRDGQLEAMKSIAIDDWQGRLTLVASRCVNGDESSLRSCCRLLSGRESIERMRGKVTERIMTDVRRALGPAACIVAELNTQQKSVLSPRTASLSKLVWALKGPVYPIRTDESPTNIVCGVERYFRLAFQFAVADSAVRFGDAVSSNSSEGLEFRIGDVVEILCCRPERLELHFPFVLQANSPNCPSYLSGTIETSLWYIRSVIQIGNPDGNSVESRAKFYVAVQPCMLENAPSSPFLSWIADRSRFNMYRVLNGRRISFAEIDSHMRKVGVIRPNLDVARGTAFLTDGDPFFALTRRKGFPPRQG